MTNLIIKGAIYTDGDCLLMAHFTGEFYVVDCTEFKTEEEIKANYSEDTAAGFLENSPLTYRGVNYYECEYSPYNTADFTLLSDLSDLEHINEESEF